MTKIVTIRRYTDRIIQGMDINEAFDHYKKNLNTPLSADGEIIFKLDFICRIILDVSNALLNNLAAHEDFDVIEEIYKQYGDTIDDIDGKICFLINLVSNSHYDKLYFINEAMSLNSSIMEFIPKVYDSFIDGSTLPEKILSHTLLLIHTELSITYQAFRLKQV